MQQLLNTAKMEGNDKHNACWKETASDFVFFLNIK